MRGTLPDQAARLQALQCDSSFIVQAPAGSGKTSLLVTRMLALLAKCNQPEQILAITFTKKAAFEMRERILKVLQNLPESNNPLASLQKKLCLQVRARDSTKQWQLLKNPNRLHIQTIDAFCAQIAARMPVTSRLGQLPKITDRPTTFYEMAVDSMLMATNPKAPWQPSLSTLLQHLEGNIELAKRLLTGMLACRDQWLPYLISHDSQPSALLTYLKRSLTHLTLELLSQCLQSLPNGWQSKLESLLRYAQSHLSNTSLGSEIEHVASWQALACMLLTRQGGWRKSVSQAQGFPAASKCHGESKAQAKAMKSKMIGILAEAPQHPSLLKSLQIIQTLPPEGFHPDEWQCLQAIAGLLPTLCAQLSVIFQQAMTADFTEISIAALQALNHHEAPSELALALDRRIEHILIDEFQDTSMTQYRLLERLTSGWQSGDGRTLFLVGDPMQSIYRFRQAEVGLFEKVRQDGLHHIQPKALTLCSNFRSDPQVIDWINTHASQCFPKVNEGHFGAVAYTPSQAANNPQDNDASAQCHRCTNATAQAKLTVRLIHAKRSKNPEASIAILVRSRSHLEHILPALNQASIPHRALAIHPLASHPMVIDLQSLTRAIAHLADKVAWLAILRAPCCGVSLDTLLSIAAESAHTTLWSALNDPDLPDQLSANSWRRLEPVIQTLNTAIDSIGNMPMPTLIKRCWQQLGGPHCYPDCDTATIAKAYFDHLKQHLASHGHYDATAHSAALTTLFAPTESHAANPIDVMTIHKAKGLEFDHVILPDCARTGAHDRKQLLLWHQNPLGDAAANWILAPLPPKQLEHSVYNLLQHIEHQKQQHELKRLLYVAITRAKHSIDCLAVVPQPEDDPSDTIKVPANSLMGLLPQAFEKASEHDLADHEQTHGPCAKPSLRRLKKVFNPKMPAEKIRFDASNRYQPENRDEKTILGTVIHLALADLSQQALPTKIETTWLLKRQHRWQHWLQNHGYPANQISAGLSEITQTITQTLSDPKGQWILQPHQAAQSEIRYICNQPAVSDQVIDRSFIHDGKRWVIDYKCSWCENAPISLTAVKAMYAQQLQAYAHIFQSTDTLPVMLGIYMPRHALWFEWPAITTAELSHAC